MRQKVTVSAPGKLLLMGDHAVVYDRPCLVAAINKRILVSIEISKNPGLALNAQDIGLNNYKKDFNDLTKGDVPSQAEYIEQILFEFSRKHQLPTGIEITTSAPNLDSKFGFGTSAATLAATASALNELLELDKSKKELFTMAYGSIINLKGVGSGADAAAAIYGSVLYFVTGGKKIQPINASIRILVAYAGYKGDTPTIVKQLAAKKAEDPEKITQIFDLISDAVERGKTLLESKDTKSFGKLLNSQQQYLQQLGVSTPELDEICSIAVKEGAWGAKLSGAGGGDIAIVLAPEDKTITILSSLEKAGYDTMEIEIAKDGVKLESYE